jgi:hypothetical protein
MSEDRDVPEIAAPPVAVEETNRLFRLTPAADDQSRSSRQMALVPADTEAEARLIVTEADPMGRDWRDPAAFIAESMETPERHVVGDLVFRSTPNPLAAKQRSGKSAEMSKTRKDTNGARG